MNKQQLLRRLFVLIPLGFLVVQTARCGIWPFNYYHDYNILKRAVLEAGCDIEHETINHDITLEEIGFTLRTPSGWKLDLFFPEDRDMDQLCKRPRGLLFQRPSGHSQVFSLAYLNECIAEHHVKLKDIGDILRRFELIAPILQANYENAEIPRTPAFNDSELHRYLWLYDPWLPLRSASHRARAENYSSTNERSEQGQHGLALRRMEFEVLTLHPNGTEKETGTAHALFYVEDLGSGVKLEMVQIQAGSFLMGTSLEAATLVQAEYVRYYSEDFAEFWHEGPPHMVKVAPYYIGKFEVTQAQWQAVRNLPKVRIDLPADPFRFKGDNLPVEYISWEQATEFCQRLSFSSGRRYRLPSEAEWEYACRAGSTSLFHFGDAITTECANYKGVYPYGSVGWGADRDHTTPVGTFAPNAFGLYDMHGNVSEFCQDIWHDTYKDAPQDAFAWVADGVGDSHPLRGGAYPDMPAQIRAASRYQSYNSTHRLPFWGFRVVASFPETSRR